MFDAWNPPAPLPRLTAAAVAALFAVSWACGGPQCGVADTVSILDNRHETYLVYRVSGFHDKVEFFEAYQGKPEFDSCGAAAAATHSRLIAQEPFLRSEGLLKKVQLHGDRLEIVYTSDPANSIEPKAARLAP